MRGAQGWLQRTAGGLPRSFWYLWTGSLINRLGSFVVIFLAIYLTAGRGLSEAQAGLVLGAWGAGGAVGTLLGGTFADRWGRRPTLLTAHLGTATMLLALGLAQRWWLLLLGAALLGMCNEGARPAYGAMMIDVVPAADRLRAYSLNYWAVNLGYAFAAVLAGLAAQVDYFLLFAVNAATTLATAAIVFVAVGETRPAAAGPAAAASGLTTRPAGLRTVFADRVFLGFVGLNVLLAVVFMQHSSMLPISMAADGLSPATFGAVIALNGVLIVAGQLFVPRLIAGRSRSHVLALAAVIVGVGFGLTAAADVAWFYAVTVLIWTVGEMLNSPSNATLIAELTPPQVRGRYQGVFSLSWSAAAFIAPIAGGAVWQYAGDTVLWLGCAMIGVVVAVGQLLAGPARERRAAELRTAELRAAEPPAVELRAATPRTAVVARSD
ncbi:MULTISPECIES: MDR family MFS transporter [unclassified Solwaraspora]|uniref:MDR family MFS transporter n=1 Tax=unclassified Solwaraspora TaxID=2627926 RepID=UPI00259B3202|nr:MFS transporter [Solwaraspora sp. WMMA2056]WJK44212.1 MFS transporter [Solwaraspora sp. WMMA2056]